MSTGEEDRIARSVALEKTYVHDVYDHMSALQYPEHRNTAPWPKVKRFLNELEPGSIVCDVGCGNGKYLKVNPSIFKIGSDRCRKLTQIAKDDDNEVLLCDNLTLPFRDESFDAVLSIAVIHHFATKERRVGALRELARVLRIGGRLMITVWAMEQKDRKFETQDVLVQWHHPQFVRTPSLEFSTTATVTSEEDFALACRLSQTHVSDDNYSIFSRSNSFRQDTRPARLRLRLFQSLRSIKTSPSSSSLSSPNETCYSFVKKALQKFSRSNKKEKHHARAWFLESWASFGKDDHLPATRYDPEGCEEDTNIQDLPIELRRMENETELQRSESTTEPAYLLQVSLTQKSKSLNDIQTQAAASAAIPITRSRSSIVTAEDFSRLKSTTTTTTATTTTTTDTEELVDTLKPKLVKQKKSICEEEHVLEEEESRDKATDMKTLVKELPMFNISIEKPTEKYNVYKQQSLTEDIMSAERLRERERVRQNIQKQASLNEDLIRKRTSDSLKDTFLTSSSRKFQMFRSGLTSKLKSSTTNIEVTGSSLKSGIARIFHSLTGGEEAEPVPLDVAPVLVSAPPSLRKSSSEDRGDNYLIERRFSHEENSDSSKDNSLQSDTSIDSEDSIISVIERTIPKPADQSTSPTMLMSPGPHSSKIALTGVLSNPSSPKISQVMQYPAAKAKALSLPASPRTLVLSPSLKQTFKLPPVAQLSTNGNGATIATPNGKSSASGLASGNGASTSPLVFRDLKPPSDDEPILKLSPIEQVTAAKLKTFTNKDMMLLTQKLTVLSSKETEPRGDVCEGDESQKSDTEQTLISMKTRPIKTEEHLSRSKSAESSSRAAYALVKKAMSAFHTHSQSHQARLQSYEIFNPETEDIDTDSSGVSTPDSFGSVISVKMDSTNGTPLAETAQSEITETEPEKSVDTKDKGSAKPSALQTEQPTQLEPVVIQEAEYKHEPTTAAIPDEALLQAAVSVVSSVESEVSSVIKQRTGALAMDISVSDVSVKSASPPPSPQPSTSKAKETRRASAPSTRYTPTTATTATASSSSGKSPGEHEAWDRECRQHIVDLAENLSERLLAEIDRYRERNIVDESSSSSSSSKYSKSDATDPYLTRLSEELSHVSKLTRELSEDLDARGPVSTRIEIETARMEVIEIEEEDSGGVKLAPDSEAMLDPNELTCEQSTEAESPGSISGWLDSRRNTIESGVRRRDTEESRASISSDQHQPDERVVPVAEKADEGVEEQHPLLLLQQKSVARRRKLSKSSEGSATTSRLSTESTDTMDVSERTASSDDSNAAKRNTMPTESSGRLSIESDLGEMERGGRHGSVETKYSGSQASLRPGESIESSDAGDISERTASVSDFSRQNTESRSVITQSSASLASWSDCSKDIRFADRRTNRCDGRSSSEETNPRAVLTRQEASTQEPMDVKMMQNAGTSISRSTSQDSLTSESGGGSIMFHRYYHVFREGELDSLIDEFVENLHIISSYYDHTNWCIIAEKVRVWTI